MQLKYIILPYQIKCYYSINGWPQFNIVGEHLVTLTGNNNFLRTLCTKQYKHPDVIDHCIGFRGAAHSLLNILFAPCTSLSRTRTALRSTPTSSKPSVSRVTFKFFCQFKRLLFQISNAYTTSRLNFINLVAVTSRLNQHYVSYILF